MRLDYFDLINMDRVELAATKYQIEEEIQRLERLRQQAVVLLGQQAVKYTGERYEY